MRIIEIRETSVPLNSTLANSSIDFSEMTTSVVAVITDVKRGGETVCGFAFNSTGRYACGAQMRARFIPRILKAEPRALLNEVGDNLAPEKILAAMMRNEKSGGHSERSVGIGTIEVAVWDAVAKIAGKPLHQLLAERFNGGKAADKAPRPAALVDRKAQSRAATADDGNQLRAHHGAEMRAGQGVGTQGAPRVARRHCQCMMRSAQSNS